MLKKTQRLSKQKVQYLLKKGKYFSNSYLGIKLLANKVQINRFSVIISKKTLASAVDRNHLRRQIYEIIRLHSLDLPNQYDCLIIVKPPLLKLPTDQIVKILLESLQKYFPTV
ncbi:MAG: ribonuclease P protein component [Candidatus Altimarinota bacterium]